MKRAIIIGATSGIGQEVAKILLKEGWKIGIAGRREAALEAFQRTAPNQIGIQALDVTQEDAAEKLHTLIERLGGMELFLLSSGIGFQNMNLREDIELNTVRTNVEGFTRVVDCAFSYFKEKGGGHLAVISSIAGTKGLGVAPAYSATKRFQNTYIDALEQLAYMQKLAIRFTDIRPGFVATDLLNDGKHYPMLMRADKVAYDIVRALKRKKRIAVIDTRYRVLVFFWGMIPRWIWKRMPVKTPGKT
ncbi:SDR family NAD(P)-dependent oxidoreductase [Bacteroides reticulotermitis]|uniref:SDR family NAD(P)-dependent oxidoreductase n=1 Tax=Bacteroides reticulotermitis TaxID=1133319 RepID=UPI001DC0712A|nr:SDR family NAD(P)-dependent oxidoreductase [Bacteroides reticulotermitis]